MKPTYCYWSVCDGAYGAMMEHCVRTARAAGVFKEFHVLTDRPLEGCESYDAYQFEKTNGLFKLHYLKAGMSRLAFDYFVWLDADTRFVRNPIEVLGALNRSPMHVPLELALSDIAPAALWKEMPLGKLRDLFAEEGITNRPYLSGSAFWIVHHDAIETVYELALGFWHKAKERGIVLDVSGALGFAMQILCADPEAHRLGCRPDLWAGGGEGNPGQSLTKGAPWVWRHPLGGEEFNVCPAIVHLGEPQVRLKHYETSNLTKTAP